MGVEPEGFFGGMPPFFSGFFIIFILMFVLIAGAIIMSMVRGVKTWSNNNAQPVLTVGAEVVAKRNDVSHRHHTNDNMGSSSSTTYYATFQVASGDRMELEVEGNEYGMLVEGDRGQLTFQGTRYKGFERDR